MKTKLLYIIAVLGWVAVCATVSHAQTIIQTSGASHIAFEAESNVTLLPGAPTSWAVVSDSLASGNSALTAGGANDVNGAPHSFAQYRVQFRQAGSYYIYTRWRADATRTVADQFTANSVWMPTSFGNHATPGEAGRAPFVNSAHNATQAPANNTYKWQRETASTVLTVTAADVNSSTPLILSVGTREAGILLDRWVLSTNPDLTEPALDALINSDTARGVRSHYLDK